MKKYQNFLSENFHLLVVKFSVYLNRHVFLMVYQNSQILVRVVDVFSLLKGEGSLPREIIEFNIHIFVCLLIMRLVFLLSAESAFHHENTPI